MYSITNIKTSEIGSINALAFVGPFGRTKVHDVNSMNIKSIQLQQHHPPKKNKKKLL